MYGRKEGHAVMDIKAVDITVRASGRVLQHIQLYKIGIPPELHPKTMWTCRVVQMLYLR
jgi:hypothetical protein